MFVYDDAMSKKPSAPSDIADKFMLRLPDGMRDRLASIAKKNKRSMNGEIVAALVWSLEMDPRQETNEGLLSSLLQVAKQLDRLNSQQEEMLLLLKDRLGEP